jgi:hypothetical protein
LLKAGGASLNSLAQKFAVSRDSIDRHWHRHVSVETKASYLCGPAELAGLAAKAALEGDSVLDAAAMAIWWLAVMVVIRVVGAWLDRS